MRSRERALPKGVWFQRKRLADGQVVRYGYYGRGPGTVRLGRVGDPEFYANLAAAVSREPDRGTVQNLIWQYKQSPEFAKLRIRTRSDYVSFLDRVHARFGPLSLKAMSAREIAGHIYKWRDSMSGSPRRADYAVQVLKVLLSWGLKRGLLDQNRASGVERLHKSDRRDSTWSEEYIDRFLEVAPPALKRALILALETGQRQGDLLSLTWAAVDGSVIRLRQSKTGARVAIPISARLERMLEEARTIDSTHVLTTSNGVPWEAKGNGFRSAWRAVCKEAGVSGVTFHDLRGTFVTSRLGAGWTTQEVAMCTGHSLRDLASLDAYADRGAVADATAKRHLARG